MKCYYHDEIDAVGTCKSCSKGLCRECAVDLGKGLACECCQQDVTDMIKAIDRNIKVGRSLRNVRKNGMAGVAFMGTLGGVFLYTGIRYSEAIPVVLGSCFSIYALYALWRTLTFPKIED